MKMSIDFKTRKAIKNNPESVDLQAIALQLIKENFELKEINSNIGKVAHFGLAIEMTGHDFFSYDNMIAHGLSRLPDDIKPSKAVKNITKGYEGIVSQMRFLSPLKASMNTRVYISGEDIHKYIEDLYGKMFKINNINFIATPEFLKMEVFEIPSRIYSAFLNLVSNAVYWVHDEDEKTIMLSVKDNKVIVSDSGPGVDEEDEEKLFSLLFTKKIRGGRGIGLYLVKTNLEEGSNSIRYLNQSHNPPLKGANFEITLLSATYDGVRR